MVSIYSFQSFPAYACKRPPTIFRLLVLSAMGDYSVHYGMKFSRGGISVPATYPLSMEAAPNSSAFWEEVYSIEQFKGQCRDTGSISSMAYNVTCTNIRVHNRWTSFHVTSVTHWCMLQIFKYWWCNRCGDEYWLRRGQYTQACTNVVCVSPLIIMVHAKGE